MAAVILVVIMCFQMCGNVSDDVTLMYAGSSYLTTVPNYEEMLAKFEEIMPYDFDGNGTKQTSCCAGFGFDGNGFSV